MNINPKLKLALKKLCEDVKNECVAIMNIVIKEFKTLIVIASFTFFLILFSLVIEASWDFQAIIVQFVERIFSWSVGLSIICTGLCTIGYKIFKNIKVDKEMREKYYWVSATFLDRVAAISLGSLGIGLAVLIFIQIFYPYLDNGTFQNNFTRLKVLILFLILTLFFFGLDVIFKYFSEEVKNARKTGKKSDYVPIVFMGLYILFFTAPSYLVIKFLY